MTVELYQLALGAIESRDLDALRAVFREHPGLAESRHPDDGGNLLHAAAWANDADLCRFLVDVGCAPAQIRELVASPDGPHAGPGSQTPLALALENDRHDAAAYLEGVAITPDNLWMAAALGDLPRVQRFFDADGNLTADARDPNKAGDDVFVLTDAMVAAAHHGHVDVLEHLLERGADPSGRDQFGMTALHYAVQGNRPLTELLLDRGADAGVRDFQFDATPYGWSKYLGHEEIAAFLETRGAG
ncbi:MAG: ankyrin repeat domain-containing protein [Planctomycetota bacterium]